MQKNHILLILSISIIFSCVREIDFLVKTEGTDTLVVDGNFTNQTGPHRVFLTRPNEYAVNSFENIKDAQVIIKDDLGNMANFIVASDVGKPYFYELPANAFQGVAGRKYHLEIKLSNGRNYQTVPQMMPNQVKLDSLSVKGRVETRVSTVDLVVETKTCALNAAFNVPNDGKDYFMRWEATGVYIFYELVKPGPLPPPALTCYIGDDFNNQVLPLQKLAGKNGESVQVEIGSKIFDKSFNFNQYITVVQRSLNQESYDYWSSLKQVSIPAGSIFDAPPGAIRGNVFNVADKNETPLGFFEVSAVDTLRRNINRTALGNDFLFSNYCVPPFFSWSAPYSIEPFPECYDCLKLQFSSLNKPWYWE
jgi:Domain of unknown function (DUF4249)